MPNIGTPELLIVLVAVLLIFGSAKLPQLARSLGKSARILKAETKGLRDEDDEDGPAGDKSSGAKGSDTAASQAPDARDRAARLREEADRLEGESGGRGRPASRRGELPAGDPIEGVPVSDYNARKSS